MRSDASVFMCVATAALFNLKATLFLYLKMIILESLLGFVVL